MGRKVNPTVVGAFVLGAVALAVLGAVVLGSGRLFRNTARFVLYFDGSVNGLRIGAPVKFRGVEVGTVTDVRLSLSQQRLRYADRLRCPVLIEIDRDRISQRGGFIPMEITDEAFADLLQRGLRGQLSTESFVTGVLYVELDLHPGSPLRLVNDPEVNIREIPTLPTTLQQVQQRASEIVNKLSQLDLDHLVASLISTVDNVNQLVSSPRLKAAVEGLDETVVHANEALISVRALASGLRTDVQPVATSVRTTADQATATFESVRTLLAPGSPIAYQLGATLRDLGEAARIFTLLAEELERNPSLLVRGRPVSKETR